MGKRVPQRHHGYLLRVVLVCVVAVFGLTALVGCEDSDVLKEFIYDQDSTQVDYDNATKVEKPSDDATEVSTTAPATSLTRENGDKSKKTATVVYSSDPETNLPVPQYKYAKDGTYDTEASEASAKTPDESIESNRSTSGKTSQKESEEASKDADDGSGQGDSKGKKSSDDSDSVKNKGGNNGKSRGGKVKVYYPGGKKGDYPQVDSIAACGSVAVAVQMVGGKGALAAADEELLNSDFAQVFADEGAADVVTAFADDGEDGKDAKVSKIIKSGAQTVCVDSDDYFSKKQKKALAAGNVSITVLAGMTSATRITKTVEVLGDMLAESSKLASGIDPQANASAYVKWHDNLVADILKTNDGYAGYNNVVYDSDITDKPAFAADMKWSVLIDDWDYTARYTGDHSDKVSSTHGVGLATMGYTSSPVSYYMGVGGAVNNAAAISYTSNDQGDPAIVWQFNVSVMNPKASNWQASGAAAGSLYGLGSSGWGNTLLRAVGSEANGAGLGSDAFPVAIVTTQKMKDAFVADSETGKGVYTAYPRVTSKDGTTHTGFIGSNDMLVMGAIQSGADIEDCVLVNPQGLFASWTEGGVESVLEAAWISTRKAFGTEWGGRNQSAKNEKMESTLKGFYSTFYRHDLSSSEVDQILEGPQK